MGMPSSAAWFVHRTGLAYWHRVGRFWSRQVSYSLMFIRITYNIRIPCSVWTERARNTCHAFEWLYMGSGSQLVTTSNYSAIANYRILQFSVALAETVTSSLGVATQRLPTVGLLRLPELRQGYLSHSHLRLGLTGPPCRLWGALLGRDSQSGDAAFGPRPGDRLSPDRSILVFPSPLRQIQG
jgi:hypothetical protein